jgi:hypothetical protein
VRLGVVDEGLGAVAALQQERLSPGDRGELVTQLVDLGGHRDRRHALQHGAHHPHRLRVRPFRLLGGRQGQRLVQFGTEPSRQRRQFGQRLQREVDGAVHGCQAYGSGV